MKSVEFSRSATKNEAPPVPCASRETSPTADGGADSALGNRGSGSAACRGTANGTYLTRSQRRGSKIPAMADGEAAAVPDKHSSMYDAAVRVYISRIFEDSVCEVQALKKNVFPKLADWCANRGLQFYVIDPQATVQKGFLNVETSLQEFRKSTIVLGILGGKCGRAVMDEKMSETAKETLQRDEQYGWVHNIPSWKTKSLLELQVANCFSYAHESSEELPKKASQFYIRDNSSFLPVDLHEVYADPFESKKAKLPVRCVSAVLDGDFAKIAGQPVFHIDSAKYDAMERMRDSADIRAKNSFDSAIMSSKYSIKLRSFETKEESNTSAGFFLGLEQFCHQVETDLKRNIRRLFPVIHPQIWPLETVCSSICQAEKACLLEYSRHNTYRKKTVDQFVSYLRSEDDTMYRKMGMLAVSGKPGIGKTSLAARLVHRLSEPTADNPLLIHHFIGTSKESTEMKSMLFRLTRDLERLLFRLNRDTDSAAAVESEDNGDEDTGPELACIQSMPHASFDFASHDRAIRSFHRALKEVCTKAAETGTHVAMVIDNINGVSQSGGESSKFSWLPDWRQSVTGQDADHWLHRLRVVILARDDQKAGIIERLGMRCQGRDFQHVNMPGLNKKQKIQFIEDNIGENSDWVESHLGADMKRLTRVLSNKMSSELPQFLTIVLRSLKEGKLSLDKVPHTMPSLMEHFLILMEKRFGRSIAQSFFSYISCSNGGIYLFELCKLLGLEPAVVMPLISNFAPFLRQHKAHGQYSQHREHVLFCNVNGMTKAVHKRYFRWKVAEAEGNKSEVPESSSDTDDRLSWKQVHLHMALFFRRQCFNANAKRKKADKAIADALEGAQDPSGIGEALARDAGESGGASWLHTTKAHVRGLQNIAYHLRQADKKVELAYTLIDLAYMAASAASNRLYELLEDLREARRVLLWGRAAQRGWKGLRSALRAKIGSRGSRKRKKHNELNAGHVQSLRDCISFMESKITLLTRYPYAFFQEASNLPASFQPATAALEVWASIVEESEAWAQNAVFFSGEAREKIRSPKRRQKPHSDERDDLKDGAEGGPRRGGDGSGDEKTAAEEEDGDISDEGDSDMMSDTSSIAIDEGAPKENADADTVDNQNIQMLCTDARRMEKGHRCWIRWVNKPSSSDPCIRTLLGHTGAIMHVAFAADTEDGYEPHLASAATDATVRIWSPYGECVAVIESSTSLIRICEFCPVDATLLATGTMNGVLQLWDIAGPVMKSDRARGHCSTKCALSKRCFHIDGFYKSLKWN